MSLDIEQILAEATEHETTVRLLLRGDLRARWDELAEELESASPRASSLGEVAPATVIARQMDELREQIKAAEVPFRLRALPPREWARFEDETKPQRAEGQSDEDWADVWHSWVCAIIAVTCADPVMTAEQVDQLSGKLSNQQWIRLSRGAWDLNNDREQVPFSVAASAQIQSDGGTSKQPARPASRSRGSSAASPPKPRRTSTTSKAASAKR